MWPFKPASPPPMPQRLREMLHAYPELIERLQESLNKVITEPVKSQPPFEVAIWALEDTLDGFIAEAREEREVAEAGGDAQAIEQAEAKERLMFRARSSNNGLSNLNELWDYFQGQGVAST